MPRFKSEAGVIHLLLIVVLVGGLIAGLFLLKDRTTFLPQAANSPVDARNNIAGLTNQLTSYALNSNSSTEQEMVNVAKRRYHELIDVLDQDPAAFLELAVLTTNNLDKLPPNIQPYIERNTISEGRLAMTHVDGLNAEDAQVKYDYSLVGDNNNNKVLVFQGEVPNQRLNGAQVNVKGIGIGSYMLIPSGDNNFSVLSSSQPRDSSFSVQQFTDNYHLGVILIDYDLEKLIDIYNSAGIDIFYSKETISHDVINDPEEFRKIVFTNQQSISSYYEESSQGKIKMAGEVFGPYTIDLTGLEKQDLRNFSQVNDFITRRAKNLAQEAGVSIDEYGPLLYFTTKAFPIPKYLCGLAAGYTTSSSIPIVYTIFNRPVNWLGSSLPGENKKPEYLLSAYQTGIHELGHVWGLGHASFYSCHGFDCSEGYRNIKVSSSCNDPQPQIEEYGDISDPMGYGLTTTTFNAPHSLFLSITDQEKIKYVYDSETYTIAALENPLSKYPQVLMIHKPDTNYTDEAGYETESYYYISYRNKQGMNLLAETSFTKGVSIHFADHWATTSFLRSYLVDTHPAKTKDLLAPNNAPLQDGESFYDLANGITITQISANEDQAVVKIDFNH